MTQFPKRWSRFASIARMPAGKHKATREEILACYENMARRQFPDAELVQLYRADGETEVEPKALRISARQIAIMVPCAVHGKPVAILRVQLLADSGHSDGRLINDVVTPAAPLLDCLCRELSRIGRQAVKSATLSERTEELQWLFELTERLHLNSASPRAFGQLTGAVVERMKCCFGAIVAPEHGVDFSYSSLVHIDLQAAAGFKSARSYYADYVKRRRQALVANKTPDGTSKIPFKLLIAPILAARDGTLGYLLFLRQETLPNFGRRQLFLALNLARQIGTMLESHYDPATGLLTRAAFCHDVLELINTSPKSAAHSLLYFNIDRLRVVNERLGYQSGDDAIAQVANLLRDPALPERALTCRAGEDRFLVFLCTFGLQNQELPLSLSCGMSRLQDADTDLEACLAAAELACQQAMRQGGNRIEIYIDFDDSRLQRCAAVEIGALRNALLEGRFCVYGQKLVSAANPSVLRGIECLIRMLDEQGRLIPPADFLPSALRHQMLQALDHWLILRTLRELKSYHGYLLNAKITVGINISEQSLQQHEFADVLERWLLESMLQPSLIRFEVTETAALANWTCTERLIHRLRQYGCGFALDDLGDGVDSLSYLKYLPVTCLKIEGAVTQQLLTSDRATAVVRAIVKTAQPLNIECVAERVESLAVAHRLSELGVHCMQGFAIHRPEPLHELMQGLRLGASQGLQGLPLDQ